MEKKLENLQNLIANALVEYNTSGGSHNSMSHALGDIELTNEVLSILACFNEVWESADSDDDQELDRILDHYTGEIINWLKANGHYEHALNCSRYGH